MNRGNFFSVMSFCVVKGVTADPIHSGPGVDPDAHRGLVPLANPVFHAAVEALGIFPDHHQIQPGEQTGDAVKPSCRPDVGIEFKFLT